MHEENTTNEFLKELKPTFNKSKEEIWNEVFEDLEDNKVETKVIPINFMKYGIAASITLLIGIGLFTRLYTESVLTSRGNHLSYSLPDGSTVTLNAETQLSYHPYWWHISREVEMEGEAFFEVEKGSKFSVVSHLGTTTVMGTSFNINTRKGYEVICKTGKVKVVSGISNILLTPNQMATLGKGNLSMTEINNVNIGWINGDFEFTSAKLAVVLDEIQRQYGIELTVNKNLLDKTYTGFFNRDQPIDSTLALVCESFDLTFVKDKNGYKILSK